MTAESDMTTAEKQSTTRTFHTRQRKRSTTKTNSVAQ